MKNLIILGQLIIVFYNIQAANFENKLLGFKFGLPNTWDSTTILESNKPQSVFEAIRDKNPNEFLTLVVYPTKDQIVDKNRLSNWQHDISDGFGINLSQSKDEEIKEYPAGKWYSVLIILQNGDKVYSYCIIKNGYSYNLSFLCRTSKSKIFVNEIDNILNSFVIGIPTTFEIVKADMNNAFRDTVNNFYAPNNFYISNQVSKKELCPYAYNLYNDLLKTKNTDFVLISRDYFNQLFCLNVKLNMVSVNSSVVNLVSKMAGNKIMQDGGIYNELFIGSWDKSPDSVFLHKYRFIKNGQETTVYIFYCATKGNKTNVIKVQLATAIENVLENDIYKLVLNNI